MTTDAPLILSSRRVLDEGVGVVDMVDVKFKHAFGCTATVEARSSPASIPHTELTCFTTLPRKICEALCDE